MTNDTFKEQMSDTLDTYFVSKRKLYDFIKYLEARIKDEESHKMCSRQYMLGYLDALCEINTKFCNKL